MDSTDVVNRLEEVRFALGMDTFQEFLERLNESLEDPFPYQTARRYHREREPSVSYVAAVARTFEVSLEWLLYGEGEMMASSSRLPSPAVDPGEEIQGARTVLASLGWSPGRVALFRDLWRRYLDGFKDEVPEPLVSGVGMYLWQFILLPLRHSGFRELDDLTQRELDDYVQAMITALGLAMPDPKKGDWLCDIGSDRLWGFRGKQFWKEDTDLPHPARLLLRTSRAIWEDEFQPAGEERGVLKEQRHRPATSARTSEIAPNRED